MYILQISIASTDCIWSPVLLALGERSVKNEISSDREIV